MRQLRPGLDPEFVRQSLAADPSTPRTPGEIPPPLSCPKRGSVPGESSAAE